MQQQGIPEEERKNGDARLIFVTHKAKERDFEATMAAVRQLEPVHRVGSILRVVGEDE
jgi:homoserine dehydrogenase